MRTIYLIGVIPPITSDAVEEHLREHLGVIADCIMLPDHAAALLDLDEEDFLTVSHYRFFRICQRLVAVSEENPTPNEGLPTVGFPVVHPAQRPSVFGRTVAQLLYNNDAQKKAPNVYKVCLTGGPCAGKTTILSTIMTKFPAHGVKVYAVPEAATILLTGGLSFANVTAEQAFRNQLIVLTTTLDLERNFLDLAMTQTGPCLIVCDRGAMDGKAYCGEETWNRIMAELNVTTVQLRDQQYDAVYHMVTAADGAEEYYGNSTNPARYETAEEARALDKRALETYLGHPHLRIIDNSTDFATKMERVLTSISEGMGITIPTHGSYRRYLVSSPAPTILPVPTVAVEVEIAILQNSMPEPELRIIARQQDGNQSYFYQKLRTVNGKPVVTERKLTFGEYQELRKQIDDDFEIIQKSSLSFTHNNQYFELGTFISPPQFAGTTLLYIEIGGLTRDLDLPPFIPVEREVTDDPKYTNMAISQTDYGALDIGRSFNLGVRTPSDPGCDGAILPLGLQRMTLKSPKARASKSHCWPAKRDSGSDTYPFSWVPKRSSLS